MGTAQRQRAREARRRVAEQRQRERRAAVRRRLYLAGGSVLLVVALVVALVVTKLVGGGSGPAAGDARPVADPVAATAVTGVPASVFDAVGAGMATGPRAISGRPELIAGGKPVLLYVGGEFCPFCAAERWALTAALARFGTFSGLRFIRSSAADVYPGTPTLTFRGAGYRSRYVAFQPVEWFGEAADPSTPFGHRYLERPTAAQQELFSAYAGGSLPFIDIGNRYLVPGVQYRPSVIAGLSWDQVARAMRDPSSPVARAIDGAANTIAAAICRVDAEGRPASAGQQAWSPRPGRCDVQVAVTSRSL